MEEGFGLCCDNFEDSGLEEPRDVRLLSKLQELSVSASSTKVNKNASLNLVQEDVRALLQS